MSKLNKEFVRIVFYFISVMFYSAADFRSVVQKEDGVAGDVVILFEPSKTFLTRFYPAAAAEKKPRTEKSMPRKLKKIRKLSAKTMTRKKRPE